ncbi:hypothetical protein N5S93_10175 [Aliarcobacter cryaerophilus]|nr:hypothetical protein [Aliarcobacter cryaerophilus]MCT7495984.1 hypothetical protein [Aliarcobacter cryaerophilus]
MFNKDIEKLNFIVENISNIEYILREKLPELKNTLISIILEK